MSVISPHQMVKAAEKLAARGFKLPEKPDRRDVAEGIAAVLDLPIPSSAHITEFIWRFLAQGETPSMEPRKFEPLKMTRAEEEMRKRIRADFAYLNGSRK